MRTFFKISILLVLVAAIIFQLYSNDLLNIIEKYIYSKQVERIDELKDDIVMRENVVIIKLKSGGELKGVIEEKSENGIIVNIGYGTVSLSSSDIENIVYPQNLAEVKTLTKIWNAQKPNLTDEDKRSIKSKTERNLYYRIREILRKQKERVKIHFKDSRKIYVTAILNDRVKANLLVDTGATIVALTPEIADRLGFDYKNRKKYPMSMADNSTVEGVPLLLGSLQVGEMKSANVKTAVILGNFPKESAHDGLLGMSYLREYKMNVDLDARVMTLERK